MFYKAIIKTLTTPTIVIFCFPLSALSTDSLGIMSISLNNMLMLLFIVFVFFWF